MTREESELCSTRKLFPPSFGLGPVLRLLQLDLAMHRNLNFKLDHRRSKQCRLKSSGGWKQPQNQQPSSTALIDAAATSSTESVARGRVGDRALCWRKERCI